MICQVQAGYDDLKDFKTFNTWKSYLRSALWTEVYIYPGVINPTELVPLLPGDHEGRQVGGVDGEEHNREQGPDRGHKPVGWYFI